MGVLDSPVAILKPDPLLVFGPDDSNNGSCGWSGLLNGTTPQGFVFPATMPSIGGGGFTIHTEDGSSSINPDNYAMAIKRLTLPAGASSVLFETWIAIRAYHNTSLAWAGPRAIDIGLDTGWGAATDGSDNRTFYAVRYCIIDEGATGPNQRWQVRQSSGGGAVTYTDFPGQPTYPLGYNENKANLMKVRLLADLVNRKVSGFSVNGLGYGQLAATPDGTLSALGAAYTYHLNAGGAASFYGGLNACIEVYNRNNITTSASRVFFSQPKVTVYS